MAYTLSLSNGTSLLGTSGLPDGTIDTTSTSLALVGKNYPGYGVFLNENLNFNFLAASLLILLGIASVNGMLPLRLRAASAPPS